MDRHFLKRDEEETTANKLSKLRCKETHLQTVANFIIPFMQGVLAEKLGVTAWDPINSLTEGLVTIEAQNSLSTLSFPPLTMTDSLEDYARIATERLLSCSARSVCIPEYLHSSRGV